jgi:hypothetical protein
MFSRKRIGNEIESKVKTGKTSGMIKRGEFLLWGS